MRSKNVDKNIYPSNLNNNAKRESNIELFRIISMLLVLLTHCMINFDRNIDVCTIISSPGETFYSTYIKSLTLICVDCFLLISGYFGIKPKIRSLFNLLFIIYFWEGVLALFFIVFFHAEYSVVSILSIFNPFQGIWYKGAYFGLFIFSFILNCYFKNTSKEKFKIALIVYISTQLVLGWILSIWPNDVMNFGNGYTVLSSLGIYLIGRYIGMYHKDVKFASTKLLISYLSLEFINTSIYLGTSWINNSSLFIDVRRTWFVSYNSIFTIAASISLLFLFSNLKFHSKIINWLSASAFSVLLIHVNYYILPYYLGISDMIKDLFWPYWWLPIIIAFVLTVYLVCFVFDQVRIALWRLVDKRMSHYKFWNM